MDALQNNFSICRKLSHALTWLCFLLALLTLAGWRFDILWLRQITPLPYQINPTTAACFLLLTAGFLLTTEKSFRAARVVGAILFSIALFIGAFRTSNHLFGWPISIDQWLFSAALNSAQVALGKAIDMAPTVSVSFVMLGISLLLIQSKRSTIQWISQGLAWIVLLIVLLSLFGFMMSIPSLGTTSYIPMAFPSVLCFIMLSLAILCRNPEQGLMYLLQSPYEGSRISRMILPTIFLFPLITGFLKLKAQWDGALSTNLAILILSTSFVYLFSTGVIVLAYFLNERDKKRLNSERLITEINNQLTNANGQLSSMAEQLRVASKEEAQINYQLTEANEELKSLNHQLENANLKIRVQSEIILHQKDKQLSRVLDSSNHVIWSLDLTGKGQHYLSNSIEKVIGLTPDEFLKKDFAEMVYPPDREAYFAGRKRLEDTGQAEGTHRYVDVHGAIHWIHLNDQIIKDEHGVPIRQEGIASDITQLKETELALQHERTLLRSLIDNIPDFIFVKDMQFKHILNNKANLELLGVATEKETLGKSMVDFFGAKAKPFIEDDRSVIHNGIPIFNKEEEFVSKNNEVKILLTTKVPLKDEEGKIIGLLGISRDITELRKHEEILNQYREKLDIIFSNTMEEILLTDTEGRIILFNKAFEKAIIKIKGIKPEVGNFLWDLTSAERKVMSQELFAKAIGGQRISVDAKFRSEDGITIHTLNYQPVFEDNKVKYVFLMGIDVTEKRKSEELLLDFQNAIYQSSIVSRTNAKGDIIYVNDNFIKVSGYSENELLGQNHRIINSGYHNDAFWADMWETITKGKTWRGEVKNKAKDGSYFWADAFVMPFMEPNGRIREFVAIRYDITKRKLIEEDLERSQHLLSKANAVGHIGSWSYDPEVNQVIMNDEAKRIFGLVNNNKGNFEEYFSLVHPDDRKQVLDAVMVAFKRKITSYEHEYRIIKPYDGQTYWVHTKADIISSEVNPRLLVGVVQDITERKKMEVTLHNYIERHEILSRATNDAIWDWNLISDTLLWNHGIESIFGYAEREIKQGQFWRSTKIHPEDNARIKEELDEVFINHRLNWVSEYRYLCADGTYKNILDRAYIIYESDKPVRVIGAMQDITEIVQYRQGLERMVEERTAELNIALQKEKESVDMKNKFISIASHEFRTPLSSIALGTGFIRKYSTKLKPAELCAKLDSIEKQVHHMTYLLDDVLLVGKSEAGKIQITPTEITLNSVEKLANEVIENMGNTHQLQVLKGCSCDTFITDEKLIRNIIINLISNAVKFSTRSKKVLLTITCDLEKLFISVTDYGIGIPESDLPSLYSNFYRGSNVGSIEGTGLGLSIVKKACELLNGKIEVTSEVNKGTVFTVTLPLTND